MFHHVKTISIKIGDINYNLQIIRVTNSVLGVFYEINILNSKSIVKVTGFKETNVLDAICCSVDFLLKLHEFNIR